jgi:hypothetical protein
VSESQPLLSRATVPSVRRGLAPCRQRTRLLTSNLGRIDIWDSPAIVISQRRSVARFRCTPSEFRAAVGCRGRRLPEVIEAP